MSRTVPLNPMLDLIRGNTAGHTVLDTVLSIFMLRYDSSGHSPTMKEDSRAGEQDRVCVGGLRIKVDFQGKYILFQGGYSLMASVSCCSSLAFRCGGAGSIFNTSGGPTNPATETATSCAALRTYSPSNSPMFDY